MTADLRVISESNFRDPAKTLRAIADEIEAGKYGDVTQVGVVVLGSACEVFGAGAEADPCVTATLLQAGAHLMIASIANHGRE